MDAALLGFLGGVLASTIGSVLAVGYVRTRRAAGAVEPAPLPMAEARAGAWRGGRYGGYGVFLQSGLTPGTFDELLGIMRSRALAAYVAAAVNEYNERHPVKD